MNVSVIATVLNEGESVRPLLESLLDQTRLPDEVVICDGGSTDNTREILAEYAEWLPLKIIEAPGANISQGRNRAIFAAAGPIIAATDAGVMLGPEWLEAISDPIREGRAPVVSGWFETDPYTDFEVVLGATVLPSRGDIDPQTFLPSSRSVAFLKSAWEEVAGYPEWLDYCEDLIFDLDLRERFGPFPFAPRAVAYFRPRSSLRAFFRQYYRYARGDGKAHLFTRRHLIRYGTYLVGLPLIFRLIWRGKWPGWLLLLSGVGAYCQRPAERLWPLTAGWSPAGRGPRSGAHPDCAVGGGCGQDAGLPGGSLVALAPAGERPVNSAGSRF